MKNLLMTKSSDCKSDLVNVSLQPLDVFMNRWERVNKALMAKHSLSAKWRRQTTLSMLLLLLLITA